MKKRLLIFLLLLLLATVALLALFFRDVKQDSLPFEVAKAILQLVVVGVAGAVGSWDPSRAAGSRDSPVPSPVDSILNTAAIAGVRNS